MGKTLVFISIAISLATAVLGFVNRGTLSSTKVQLEGASQEVTQAKQSADEAKKKLTSVTGEKAAAEAERDTFKDQAEKAQASADEAKKQVTDLNNQIGDKTAEISKLTTDKQELEAKLAQNPTSAAPVDTTELDNLKKEIEAQKIANEAMQAQLDTAKAQASTLEQEKKDRMALKMRDGLQGRILAVNKAWNFVVLNLGDKNGVVSNAEMLVKRGNNLIGKVRVTSVEPSTSIADIDVASLPQGIAITPGDSVIFRSATDEQ